MLGEIIAALLAKIMLRCRAILILKITVYCLLISIHDGSPILFFSKIVVIGVNKFEFKNDNLFSSRKHHLH